MNCFFFGCWNEAGHYLFAPGGRSVSDRSVCYYGDRVHIDASLAPRVMGRARPQVRPAGSVCWAGMLSTSEGRDKIEHNSVECPQGQFLHHHLTSGYTAIQWWDRCQGGTRGACNSTVLLEGRHTSDELLAALRENFPHVLENLKRGGPLKSSEPRQSPVELTEVRWADVP